METTTKQEDTMYRFKTGDRVLAQIDYDEPVTGTVRLMQESSNPRHKGEPIYLVALDEPQPGFGSQTMCYDHQLRAEGWEPSDVEIYGAGC